MENLLSLNGHNIGIEIFTKPVQTLAFTAFYYLL